MEKKRLYEKPLSVGLNRTENSLGTCELLGSGDGDACSTGNTAAHGGCYIGNGATHIGCFTGNSATTACSVGNDVG